MEFFDTFSSFPPMKSKSPDSGSDMALPSAIGTST
eukprot:04942.XXX_206764_206868_1 [CDS] Oithona nana genome sequencing.